jgi:hypothetical protein
LFFPLWIFQKSTCGYYFAPSSLDFASTGLALNSAFAEYQSDYLVASHLCKQTMWAQYPGSFLPQQYLGGFLYRVASGKINHGSWQYTQLTHRC